MKGHLHLDHPWFPALINIKACFNSDLAGWPAGRQHHDTSHPQPCISVTQVGEPMMTKPQRMSSDFHTNLISVICGVTQILSPQCQPLADVQLGRQQAYCQLYYRITKSAPPLTLGNRFKFGECKAVSTLCNVLVSQSSPGREWDAPMPQELEKKTSSLTRTEIT